MADPGIFPVRVDPAAIAAGRVVHVGAAANRLAFSPAIYRAKGGKGWPTECMFLTEADFSEDAAGRCRLEFIAPVSPGGGGGSGGG